MKNLNIAQEYKATVYSILISIVMIPTLIYQFVSGGNLPILVFTIGCLIGYIIERILQYKKISVLHQRIESLTPEAQRDE